jgi:plastocyanin
MTWLWRISFNIVFFLLAGQHCGSLLCAGTVTVKVELVDSRDSAVRRRGDLSGVVVWLEPLTQTRAHASPSKQIARMVQKDKRFQPHILPIEVGTAVDFPNYDPIFHNAFSNYEGQIFDVGLYPPGTSRRVVFRRPGIVRIFCNIHSLMSAVIMVLETPYFGASDRTGIISITDVPPGRYRLKVFHERALSASLNALERIVDLDDNSLQLPVLRISESGYVPGDHANKYGKPYPERQDDHIMYPGVRR